MYTGGGQEVRSFSQLRNEFAEIDTFYLGTSMVPSAAIVQQPIIANNVQVVGSPIRRSRSRAGLAAGPPIVPIVDDMGGGGGGGGGVQSGTTNKMAARQRARSKSRPRVLYAPENEIVRPSGGKKPFYFYFGNILHFKQTPQIIRFWI